MPLSHCPLKPKASINLSHCPLKPKASINLIPITILLLLISSLFLTTNAANVVADRATVKVYSIPTPTMQGGLNFFIKIVCGENPCDSKDTLTLRLAPHSEAVGPFVFPPEWVTSAKLGFASRYGMQYTLEPQTLPLTKQGDTFTGSMELPAPIPAKVPFYINGTIAINISTEGQRLLFSNRYRLEFVYQPTGTSAPIIDGDEIIWYESQLSQYQPRLTLTPQLPARQSRHDSPPEPAQTALVAAADSYTNWDLSIVLPRVILDPYFFDINFYGLYYASSSSTPICTVNGNGLVKTTLIGKQWKSGDDIEGDTIRFHIDTSIPHTESFDNNIDMYLECQNANFYIPDDALRSDFGWFSVVISPNSTRTTPREVRPAAVFFPLNQAAQYLPIDDYDPKSTFVPVLIDAHISPIIETQNQAQLPYKTIISTSFGFSPLDRKYHVGFSTIPEDLHISPADLYSAESLSKYTFELEITWSTQSAIMVDSTWTLGESTTWRLPAELIPDTYKKLNTFHSLKSAPILANRFHQQVSWISSPFQLTFPQGQDPFKVPTVPYYENVVRHDTLLRLNIIVFHQNIPEFDSEQTPTIILHVYYHNDKIQSLAIDDFGLVANGNWDEEGELQQVQLEDMKEQQSPSSTSTTKLSTQPVITTLQTTPAPTNPLPTAAARSFYKSVSMSHLRRIKWPINVIPVLNPEDNETWLYNMAMKPYYYTNAKTHKNIGSPVGYGFSITFTTDLPLLYKDEGFKPDFITLDLTMNALYNFHPTGTYIDPTNLTTSTTKTATPTTTTTTDNSFHKSPNLPPNPPPPVQCFWNDKFLPWINFLDAFSDPITIYTPALQAKYPDLQLEYHIITIKLPEGEEITSDAVQYSLRCDGPFVIPSAENDSPAFTDRPRNFVRLKTWYWDGGKIPSVNALESQVVAAVDVPFEFGEPELDTQLSRGLLLFIISLPCSFLITGVLVWIRYRHNEKSGRKRAVGTNGDIQNHAALKSTQIAAAASPQGQGLYGVLPQPSQQHQQPQQQSQQPQDDRHAGNPSGSGYQQLV